jgi:hypothetical protein
MSRIRNVALLDSPAVTPDALGQPSGIDQDTDQGGVSKASIDSTASRHSRGGTLKMPERTTVRS